MTIFNRSEVIGRPLAIMMSNDGARVISFDEFGPLRFENAEVHEIDISRAKALSASDIVITGVPSANFPQIMPAEITPGTVCVNFSSYNNFNEAITEHTAHLRAEDRPYDRCDVHAQCPQALPKLPSRISPLTQHQTVEDWLKSRRQQTTDARRR